MKISWIRKLWYAVRAGLIIMTSGWLYLEGCVWISYSFPIKAIEYAIQTAGILGYIIGLFFLFFHPIKLNKDRIDTYARIQDLQVGDVPTPCSRCSSSGDTPE